MRTLDAEEKISLRSTELPDAISAIFEASCDVLIRWCSFSLSEQITVAVRFPQVHFAFIYDRQMNDKECIITKSHAYLKLTILLQNCFGVLWSYLFATKCIRTRSIMAVGSTSVSTSISGVFTWLCTFFHACISVIWTVRAHCWF